MFSANRSNGRSRLTSFDLSSSRPRSTSMSMLNRDSFGGYARRASSEERKSGNGNIRRLSGARNSIGNAAKATIKDMRPLTDKVFQKKKLNELAEFLDENNFFPSLTVAKLMSPSKKEFEMIFQFLVSFCDPSFQVKNLDEDAPRALKNLGYPFIPNKSAFTYVARTSFASLLGVLLYLLDLAKIILNSDLQALYKTGDSARPDEHAVLMDYILQCQKSGNENEDEMIEVFKKIVQSRNNEDYGALIQERDVYKEKLNKVEKELEKIEHLQKEIENIDSRIKQYEEYFQGMAKRKEKREAAISKLEEDLQMKKSILQQLDQQLSQRQAIYDAQGFDGKKQLSHFEEQKKQLNNTLEETKNKLKEIQEECWDMELSHSRVLDKGVDLCKGFNQKNTEIKDSLKAVLQKLQGIKETEVQTIINNIILEFPEFPQEFNKSTLLSWSNIHEDALEEVHKKISTSNIIIKTLLSASSEELTEIEMKKLQLSAKLKWACSTELQKEHDLCELEKQAISEVKALEKKCDEDLKQLEDLRKVSRERKEEYSKLKSDLLKIEELKLNKIEMLEKYLEEQKKFFDKLATNVNVVLRESKACGDEIASTLEELLKKKNNQVLIRDYDA